MSSYDNKFVFSLCSRISSDLGKLLCLFPKNIHFFYTFVEELLGGGSYIPHAAYIMALKTNDLSAG